METIDKEFLEDANNIISYYLSSLYFFQGNMLDKSTYNDEMQQTMTDELAAKISLIQMANMITTSYETIKNNESDPAIKSYAQAYISSCSAYKKLNWPANTTEEEKLKYIRDFFAHARYEYTSNGEVYIQNSDPIEVEGTLTMQDMAELQEAYLNVYYFIKREERNHIFVIDNDNPIFKSLNYSNDALLSNLRKIKVIKDSIYEGKVLKQACNSVDSAKKILENPNTPNHYTSIITTDELKANLSPDNQNALETGLEPLSEEQVQKIFEFIKANRLRYNNVPPEVYLQEIVDYSIFSFSSSTMLDKNRYLNYFLKNKIESDIKIPVDKPDATINKQMAYASNLIDLVYFCFGFIKENSKDEKEANQILYGDYDITPFKIKVMKKFDEETNSLVDVSKDDYIKRKDTKGEIEKKLYGKNPTDKSAIVNVILNLEERIENRKKLIENLKIHNPSQVAANEAKLAELEQELSRQEQLKELHEDDLKYKEYYHVNQSNFFAHLRNAITHNFYEFDFSEALKEGRMGLLKITFRDYNTQGDGKINFEATIDARHLISLCTVFKFNIKEYLDRYDVVTKPKTM